MRFNNLFRKGDNVLGGSDAIVIKILSDRFWLDGQMGV
jgi:hypothetical protein